MRAESDAAVKSVYPRAQRAGPRGPEDRLPAQDGGRADPATAQRGDAPAGQSRRRSSSWPSTSRPRATTPTCASTATTPSSRRTAPSSGRSRRPTRPPRSSSTTRARATRRWGSSSWCAWSPTATYNLETYLVELRERLPRLPGAVYGNPDARVEVVSLRDDVLPDPAPGRPRGGATASPSASRCSAPALPDVPCSTRAATSSLPLRHHLRARSRR